MRRCHRRIEFGNMVIIRSVQNRLHATIAPPVFPSAHMTADNIHRGKFHFPRQTIQQSRPFVAVPQEIRRAAGTVKPRGIIRSRRITSAAICPCIVCDDTATGAIGFNRGKKIIRCCRCRRRGGRRYPCVPITACRSNLHAGYTVRGTSCRLCSFDLLQYTQCMHPPDPIRYGLAVAP